MSVASLGFSLTLDIGSQQKLDRPNQNALSSRAAAGASPPSRADAGAWRDTWA